MIKYAEAVEVAQVTCLSCKYKYQSSVPRAPVKVLSMVVHTCTPNAGELEGDTKRVRGEGYKVEEGTWLILGADPVMHPIKAYW